MTEDALTVVVGVVDRRATMSWAKDRAGRLLRNVQQLDNQMWVPSEDEDRWLTTWRPMYMWLAERLFLSAIIWWFGYGRARRLMQSGQVKVYGLERFYQVMDSDKGVLLVSNHPSLVEPMLLVGLHWRKMLCNHRYYPYSTPDDALFPTDKKDFFYRYGRCIPVDRSGEKVVLGRSSLRRIYSVLKQGYCLILFAEGGRTFKYASRGKRLLVGEMLPSGRQRQISELNDDLVKLATATGALIVTVYVDVPKDWSQLEIGQALDLVLKGDMSGSSIYFGSSFEPEALPKDKAGRAAKVKQIVERVQNDLLFPVQIPEDGSQPHRE